MPLSVCLTGFFLSGESWSNYSHSCYHLHFVGYFTVLVNSPSVFFFHLFHYRSLADHCQSLLQAFSLCHQSNSIRAPAETESTDRIGEVIHLRTPEGRNVGLFMLTLHCQYPGHDNYMITYATDLLRLERQYSVLSN